MTVTAGSGSTRSSRVAFATAAVLDLLEPVARVACRACVSAPP